MRSNSTPGPGDDRKGLGYGQLKQTFHAPYLAPSNFPYASPDEDLDDVELGDGSQDAVNKKVATFQPIDPGAARSANRLYFVGAATKLTACFERPDDVLSEISALARDEYVPGNASVGGAGNTVVRSFSLSKAFDERPYRRTGTKRGWSRVPPMSKVASEDASTDEELYTLDDIADVQRSSLGESFCSMDILSQGVW